jgi:hypothetical protein
MPTIDDEADQPTSDTSQEGPREQKAKDKSSRPSLVINVYSWATPVLAVLMLVVGLLAGYFGRPLIAKETAATAGGASEVLPTPDPADDARRQEMMTYLVGQVRHFIGEEDAPVTIIEFSDFQ